MYSAIIALVISGVTAVSMPRSPFDHPLARLLARQGTPIDPSTIPTQCRTTCGPIISDLQGCTSNTCACVATVRDHFETCMNCFISSSNGNPSVVTAAQNAASGYVSACKAAGLTVTPITFSGAPAGGASATSGGGSAQISGATISTPTADAGGPVEISGATISTPTADAGGPVGISGATISTPTPVAGGSGSGAGSGAGSGSGAGTSQNPGAGGSGGSSLSAAAAGASAHVGLAGVAMALGALTVMW